MEPRANPNHDPQSGKFTSGPGSGSAKAGKGSGSRKGITVGKKKFAKLCGTLNTQYPGLKAGEKCTITDAKYQYRVTADGYGGMIINSKFAIERGRKK